MKRLARWKKADLAGYEGAYSARSFWKKVRGVSKRVGGTVLKPALELYYAVPKVPLAQKALVLAALGYFISPVDAIPDFLAGLGFSDDVLTLGAVVKILASHIDDEAREKARGTLRGLGLEQK